jgi:hypothetical protein
VPEERDLACDLFLSTSNGDGWAATCKAGWEWCTKKQGTAIPCCEWHGVKCNSAGHMIILELGGCNLRGSIRLNAAGKSIFSAPALTEFHVEAAGGGAQCKTREQGIGGGLPADLANAENLEVLGLYCNAFTGTLAALTSLRKLKQVDAHYNFFTGLLPSFANSASTLVYISFANNNLTGTIPSDYAKLQALTTLGLAYNSLHGRLDVVANLPNLVVIFLRSNAFTGSIPIFHPAAQVVDIDNNQLDSIPTSICSGTLPGAYKNNGGCNSDWPNQPIGTCCMASNPIVCKTAPPCLSNCGDLCVPPGTIVVSTWTALAKHIDACIGKCSFVLARGFTSPDGITQIIIRKGQYIIINGQGEVTLDGNGQQGCDDDCGMFVIVNGGSLSIAGVTMQNTNDDQHVGGAIVVDYGGNLEVISCTFRNNTGRLAPGLKYSSSSILVNVVGVATITSCKFEGIASVTNMPPGGMHPGGTITFACPSTSTGAPVQMKKGEVLEANQLPPAKEVVHCTPKEQHLHPQEEVH